MSENPIRLPQFLKQVDNLSKPMSAENLRAFLHEMARTLPEENRSSFLIKLQGMQKTEGTRETSADRQRKIKQEIDHIIKKLEEIQNGAVCLDSEINEEWDDWNGRDEDEFIFSDPQNLLAGVRQAVQMIHTCIDQEYTGETAAELVEILSVLEVQAEGDYLDCDGNPLSLYDLYDCGLLKGDYHKLLNECLYLIYMGSASTERPERMFNLIENMECSQPPVRLEEIMQMGNGELPEFDLFLKDWLRYLGNRRGGRTERLLAEAQSMISDDHMLLENARDFADTHPSLYLSLLKEKKHTQKAETMLAIGCEALAKIPVSYVIRAQVALVTADYANQLQRREKAEWCWLEAFRSDTSVVNYMRFRFEASSWELYKEKVRNIIEGRYREPKTQWELRRSGECEKNEVSETTYCTLLFLEQDFEKMRNTGMATQAALGWSGTFMKEGISLMLLLLYAGSMDGGGKGGKLPAGLQEMRSWAIYTCDFHPEAYQRGVGRLPEKNQSLLFDKLFTRWKSEVTLTENEQKLWLQRIDRWMEHRVRGIMENNRRNYYEECAAFLAALSEVLESMGEIGAKNRCFERYRKAYPRRSSFISAMHRYGMGS